MPNVNIHEIRLTVSAAKPISINTNPPGTINSAAIKINPNINQESGR